MRETNAGSSTESLDLNLLRTLHALIQTRSVTRAGERLELSQPAASRAVAKLRKLLADPLLVRTSKGYVLTPRAEALASAVASALHAAQQVFTTSTFDPGSATRHFNLATTDYGAIAVVAPVAPHLSKQAPGCMLCLTPWSDAAVTERCIGAFMMLPVAIHLDGGAIIDRFSDVTVRRIGAAATLSLTELPLSPVQVILKRGCDVVGAAIGLVCAAPALAIAAIAIKIDSPGPVFFRQKRLGFNQQPFEILKLRSMTTQDNGERIEQAKVGDIRITRVGRFIRRWNLDELPQLINVLRGDMSLVGPRPHAIAHDREFEIRVRRYPRRLNMKPGITGWAQVNGFRGETDTDEKLRNRVEHDLYYIDNWSLAFDAYIVMLTVLSPRSYKNAV